MAIATKGENKLEDIIRDLKSYTSRHIRKYMTNNPYESRKEGMPAAGRDVMDDGKGRKEKIKQ